MTHSVSLIDRIFNCADEKGFNSLANEVFLFQHKNNAVYRQYCDLIHCKPEKITNFHQIPFLPIDFFRRFQIKSFQGEAEVVFTSSGTTGAATSSHFVADKSVYENSFKRAFKRFYGDVRDYCIVALLPSYLERTGSSLVYMATQLITESKHPDNGFYLYEFDQLHKKLLRLKEAGQKTLLLGVTYALLDFAADFPLDFPELIVMETGGMKGKRKEMIREEVHEFLRSGFGVSKIHSEYGMTELLSQAYSKGDGIFETPPWMKILIRDTNDPLSLIGDNKNGGINVIDLSNIYSCSFIATQDLGKTIGNETFEVVGRFDQSQVRGCNLMVG